jgi:hypothetical protein
MDYQTIIKLHKILMTINLKLKEHIYKLFNFYFFYIYLEIQNNSYQWIRTFKKNSRAVEFLLKRPKTR